MGKREGETPEEKAARKAKKEEKKRKAEAAGADKPAKKAKTDEADTGARKSPRLEALRAAATAPPSLELGKSPKGGPKKSPKSAAAFAAGAIPALHLGTIMSPAEYRASQQISVLNGDAPEPWQSFDMCAVQDNIKLQLTKAGFPAPSPIQAQAWPIALNGKDMIAVAKTGSGKTLGFLIPAYVLIKKSPIPARGAGPIAVVLAPTRELAVQIEAENHKFGFAHGIRGLCCYGGTPKGPMIRVLRGFQPPHIVTATPGRLNDLLQMSPAVTSMDNCKYVVLDEADRMLDMGFEPQIKTIIDRVPAKGRQTLFFTATWPKDVQQLANSYLNDDRVHVTIGNPDQLTANKSITQKFHQLENMEKMVRLEEIIADLPEGHKTLVFANQKRNCESLAKACIRKGMGAGAIHGDKEQWERDKALKDFVNGTRPLLFATDVAARGLDVKGVSHVINYDMPQADSVENYVHRIGRTGRAGNTGTAITFLSDDDTKVAAGLLKILREAQQEVPDFLEEWAARRVFGGGKGRYGGKGRKGGGKGKGKGKGKGGGGKGKGRW